MRFGLVVAAGMTLLPIVAAAQDTPPSPVPLPGAATETQSPIAAPNPSETTGPGLLDRERLLGEMGGLRPALAAHGISLSLSEASEVLGNATGGQRRGLVYEGLTNMTLDADLEKAVGWAGATVRISALQIHGRGLSANSVGNLNVTSSAEATRATRLYELWLQQVFWGGKADLRLGQQSADLEFATSTYGGLFVNASFGWPTSFATSLPGGGPAYPLGVLGARLRLKPRDDTTLLLGVFNGSPAAPGVGDPQLRNAHGTSFRLDDGVFAIGEAQYTINSAEGATGLPGTYKLGGWYHSRAFTDQRYVATAGSAEPVSGPGRPNDDWSLYAVADQLVWQPAGSKDGGVGVFARVAGSPGGRNQVNVFGNAGVTWKGAFGRANDTVGFGMSWAHISETARDRDRQEAALAPGSFFPIRSSETLLELTYQAQVLPAVILQPVAQYVFRPGGGVVDPNRPDKRLGDAAIFGVRTSITF